MVAWDDAKEQTCAEERRAQRKDTQSAIHSGDMISGIVVLFEELPGGGDGKS